MRYFLAIFLVSSSAFAADTTVTLTQAELQSLISAESSKAIANYIATEAKGTYDKVKEAFVPKVSEGK